MPTCLWLTESRQEIVSSSSSISWHLDANFTVPSLSRFSDKFLAAFPLLSWEVDFISWCKMRCLYSQAELIREFRSLLLKMCSFERARILIRIACTKLIHVLFVLILLLNFLIISRLEQRLLPDNLSTETCVGCCLKIIVHTLLSFCFSIMHLLLWNFFEQKRQIDRSCWATGQ